MTRCWLALLVACGESATTPTDVPSSTDLPEPTDTGPTTDLPPPPPTEPSCPSTGTAGGCLLVEADCTGTETTFDGTPGGYFSDLLGENVYVTTASSPAGMSLEFTIFGPRVLHPSDVLTWPMELSATLTDRSNPDTTAVYHACRGTLVIDAYEMNTEISVSWSDFRFENSTGLMPCQETPGWLSAEGLLTQASFCVP